MAESPPKDPPGAKPRPPLWGRVAKDVRAWFKAPDEQAVSTHQQARKHATPTPRTAGAPALALVCPPELLPFKDKLVTAQQAVVHIGGGDHVFVGTACATPRTLIQALEALELPPLDVELLHFLTDAAVPHDAQGQPLSRYRHRSFFVGTDMRAAVRNGSGDYVPISIARVPELMALGRIRVDVALIQVSLPDAQGRVSLGVSVDIAPAALACARLVIAEVNPAMPRSAGEFTLSVEQIHHLVLVDTPVIEYSHTTAQEPAVERIARYIGGVIEDGSTLQVGLGRFSNEAFKYLTERKDLGIHSDVITDAIIPLLERGILTGQRKTQHAGRIVTSFAMGTRRLYDLIDGNPLFLFQPIDEVCNPESIAAQHRMVSVTQAFAVDLTGQVCADQFNGEFYGGLAAQAEFLQGASRSVGGKAIICLTSTDDTGEVSRIRSMLAAGEGVAVARGDVHYIITEFGIAYLFGKSIRERATALIEVAHPKFREDLFAQAQALGYLPAGQLLKNMRAYPVEDEVQVQLKDARSVLLRPATASDGDAVRDMFHGLSAQDVYTRFFRKVRGMSSRDVQRLCNLNFDTEIGFVAVTGAREGPRVVAHACYFIDPKTQLAETAFMVLPEWQGSGLGSALQRHMAAHAVQRGVLGFVAEIMASNENMIRLARAGPGESTIESQGSTVRVTRRF